MEKIVGGFLQFPGVVVTLLILSYAFTRRKTFLVLAVVSYVLTTDFFLLPVQKVWVIGGDPISADVVVLGGGIIETPRGYQPTRATLSRLKTAYDIWKKFGGKIYVSGGKVYEDVSEASVMRRVLVEWGVPKEDVIEEENSRNTKENVKFLSSYLPEKFNLVTSAVHMRRAVMVFHSFGMKPNPVPADYLIDRSISLMSFLPSEEALDFLSELSHEIIGIVYYRIGGI